MPVNITPPITANPNDTYKFAPMANCRDGMRYKLEQEITDKDAIELMVPVAQPSKCACMSKNGVADDPAPLNSANNTVELMTG